MEITDHKRAEDCLSRIGYYRLSAYWYSFRQSKTAEPPNRSPEILDDFREGTTFPLIHDIYVFDKRLRLIVMDALERIEIGLRTQISLLLGKIDPWAHRNSKMLHGNFAKRPARRGVNTTKHDEWLDRLDKKFASSKEDFAKHFHLNYGESEPPIWISVEVWDFGTLSHFYAGMRYNDKLMIAQSFGNITSEQFETWIRCLNDIRNLCAHHSRLWNRPLVNNPQFPRLGAVPSMDHVLDETKHQTRLYGAMVTLQHLLKHINPSSVWSERLISHVSTLPTNAFVTLDSAGFPTNWEALPIWKASD